MAKRYYEEMEPKKMEAKDGGMLHYDFKEVANMPQTVKYHEWPDHEGYLGDASPELDDTIHGINKLIGENVAKGKKHKQYNKW